MKQLNVWIMVNHLRLYLKFWDELSPFILEMFQWASKSGCFNRGINTIIVTLLHKRGKASTLCSSFHPLSLLNADIKLYAKVLVPRLQTVLPTLVHSDQTGFVKQSYTVHLIIWEIFYTLLTPVVIYHHLVQCCL